MYLDTVLGPEASVVFSECKRHHDYLSETNGPDIMVCTVDDVMGDPAPDVPIVPIMVPTGPARDWLYHEIYGHAYQHGTNRPTPKVIPVGAGLTTISPFSGGDKLQGAEWIQHQTKHHGTSTKLYSADGWDDTVPTPNPLEEFIGTQEGDSGSPLFVDMPDGSWRQIGVLHSGNPISDYHEAAPSYLNWIEGQAADGNNDWTTPCHEYVDGEWVWQGNCQGSFPVNPDESYESNWTNDCAGVTYGGGYYSNAALTPPSPSEKTPGEAGDSPLVPLSALDLAYPTALSKAQNGDFGMPATQIAIADYLLTEVESDALHPFLGTAYKASNRGFFVQTSIEGDFNGDGNPDGLHSHPYGECGKGLLIQDIAGGSTSIWSRDTSGVLGTSACGDYFGAAVASGDFDGDGYDDLAASAPGSAVGTASQAGSLSILYGSSTGLTASGDQFFHQDVTGISENAEDHDFLGEALTAGDFNCDGYDDIAIGVPREDDGTVFDAGTVVVLYGSLGGLTTSSSAVFYQGVNGVDDSSDAGDHFGAALAAGNFNGDEFRTRECYDLAIGVPFEDVGRTEDAGSVYVMMGSTAGLTTSGDQTFHQDVIGVTDTAEAGDHFGANITTEDDGLVDGLSIQVPGESCSATYESSGQHRFYGGSAGLTISGNIVSCDEVFDAFNSYAWGVLEHATDYYAIRVLEEM